MLATLVQNGDGTWTFTRGARQRFVFDSAGKLIKELDLNGVTTTLAYSGTATGGTAPAGASMRGGGPG